MLPNYKSKQTAYIDNKVDKSQMLYAAWKIVATKECVCYVIRYVGL